MTEVTSQSRVLTENLTIFSDSVSIMTKTANPKTFFARFYAAVKCADELARSYCMCELYSDVDEWCEIKEKLMSSRKDLITDLANRIYELSDMESLRLLLTEFANELDTELFKYIESLCKKEQ